MEQAAFLQVIPRINFLVIPALCPLLAQLPSPKYYTENPRRLSPRLFFLFSYFGFPVDDVNHICDIIDQFGEMTHVFIYIQAKDLF